MDLIILQLFFQVQLPEQCEVPSLLLAALAISVPATERYNDKPNDTSLDTMISQMILH